MMTEFLNEIRLALRALRRSPMFTATVLLTLALGVGANTGMFSATYSLLLAPLPYSEPDRLVALHTAGADGSPRQVSLLDLQDWRSGLDGFESLAGYRLRSFGLQRAGGQSAQPAVIQVGMTTADLFRVLGTEPVLGRSFTEQEEAEDAAVIVLSDQLWRTRLGGDLGIVGETVLLNEAPKTVVGVLPPGFEFSIRGRIPDAYIPISHADYGGSRATRSLDVVARIEGDMTFDAGRSELQRVASQLAQAYPDTNTQIGADLRGLHEALRGANRTPLLLLAGAALALLLITCTNVANLFLERFLLRSKEASVRIALGASGGQLLGHYLAEGLVVSALGAGLGLLVARGCLALLPSVLPLIGGVSPVGGQRLDLLQLDINALAFAVAITIMTGLVFAMAPATLARRLDPARGLGGGVGSRTRTRFRGGLVVAQVSFSAILTLSAMLLLRSFLLLLGTDPGFQTTGVLRFGIGLPEQRYDTEQKMINFHERLCSALEELPGVDTVGAIARLPLGGSGFTAWFLPEGVELPREERPRTAINVASPGYFASMGIPVLAGRPFTWQDSTEQPRVVLVNEAFAESHLPDGGFLGPRLRLSWWSELNPRDTAWEVVGVVGNTRQVSLEEAPRPEIYLSMSQFPLEGGSYTILTTGTNPAVAEAIPSVVESIDGQLEGIGVSPLSARVDDSLGDRRLALLLVGTFAGVALALTIIGLYGVVAFSVADRSREIGIRRALGAQVSDVLHLVAASGLRLAVGGLLIGFAGFLLVSRWIESQLYGVTAADPVSGLIVTVTLCVAAALASFIPAMRAVRSSPSEVIRDL
jgi:putative ABC transport system permease protein